MFDQSWSMFDMANAGFEKHHRQCLINPGQLANYTAFDQVRLKVEVE